MYIYIHARLLYERFINLREDLLYVTVQDVESIGISVNLTVLSY